MTTPLAPFGSRAAASAEGNALASVVSDDNLSATIATDKVYASEQEENEDLRRQIDSLLQAKEKARLRVQQTIQVLVDENKQLQKKLEHLETQQSSLVKERQHLLERVQQKEAAQSSSASARPPSQTVSISAHANGSNNPDVITRDRQNSIDANTDSSKTEDSDTDDSSFRSKDSSSSSSNPTTADIDNSQKSSKRMSSSSSSSRKSTNSRDEIKKDESPSPTAPPADPAVQRGRQPTVGRRGSGKLKWLVGENEATIKEAVSAAPAPLTIEKEGIILMGNEQNTLIDVREGTVEKLIEYLYHEDTTRNSPTYVPVFILTHKAFTTTPAVLNYLMSKYGEATGDNNKVTRLRIIKVLENWTEVQPEDFEDSNEGSPAAEVIQFVKTKVTKADGDKIAKKLKKKLSRPQLGPAVEHFKYGVNSKPIVNPLLLASSSSSSSSSSFSSSSSAASLSSSSNSLSTSSSVSLSPASSSGGTLSKKDSQKVPKPLIPRAKITSLKDVSHLELARQMTLLDFELFQRIRPSEYNALAWTKRNKETTSPNLLRMIRRFNDISVWVQYMIVTGKTVAKRAEREEYFIKLGEEFLKLRNFNGIMQIVSAFEGAAVHRLGKTSEKLKPRSRRMYQQLHDLMSSSSGYRQYRERLTAGGACVPYMGVYLTDLITIDEGYKTKAAKYPHYINFQHHTQVAILMKMMMQFQDCTYPFQTVPVIREWLEVQFKTHGSHNEEELYNLSLEAEPRDPSSFQV